MSERKGEGVDNDTVGIECGPGHDDCLSPKELNERNDETSRKNREQGDHVGAEQEASEQPEELKDQLLRALAEIENVRKRANRERDEAAKYGVTNFARDVVGIADNLRRAIESVEGSTGDSDKMMQSLQAGITIIQQEFDTMLSRHGVEAIDPLGEPFNHNFHQAMFEVEQDDKPAGTVMQVLQQGYKIHERLLRPAMVGVVKKRSDQVSEPENGV